MAAEAEQLSTVARMEDAAAKALLAVGGLLRRAEVSPDGRALYQVGGRQADTFYRDRWSYDKVVPSWPSRSQPRERRAAGAPRRQRPGTPPERQGCTEISTSTPARGSDSGG